MAIQFYKLKVKNIIRETKEAVTVVFEVPYVLKDTFKYKQGQYLTLRFTIDGKDERRAYSISSSPELDYDLHVTIKEVERGVVSSFINKDLKIGEIVDMMPPLGNFVINLNPNNSNNYVFIAGGSGITPIFSMIRSALNIEKNSKCLLIYANKNQESRIFNDELNKLAENSNLKIIDFYSKPNDSSESNRINEDKILEVLKNEHKYIYPTNDFFICGPQGILDLSLKALSSLEIAKDRIHKESFTASLKLEEVIENDSAASDEVSAMTVILYGEETVIPTKKSETILISGMKARIDPPFSCQIGACSTCRAKLTQGKVKMDDYDALTDSEIAQGYILTCTAHAITNDVIVDYDS